MIEARIAGIPCLVEMTSGYYLKGSYSYNAPSDVDYYGGWQDLEYAVYDRRGRPAPWLERKITPRDNEEILEKLMEAAEHDETYD